MTPCQVTETLLLCVLAQSQNKAHSTGEASVVQLALSFAAMLTVTVIDDLSSECCSKLTA